MNHRPTRFSDAQVAHILKRAAEIDARGDTMSAEDLRAIAAEAGIDPRATDAAIRELLAEEEGGSSTSPEPGTSVAERSPRVPARKAALPLPWRVATGGAVGAACGFVYGLSAGGMMGDMPLMTANVVIGLGTAALYAMVRGVQNMSRGDQRDFQVENLAVWIGAALGALPRVGPWWHLDDVLAPLIFWWFVVAVVGGLLVRSGRRERTEPDEPPRIGAGAG